MKLVFRAGFWTAYSALLVGWLRVPPDALLVSGLGLCAVAGLLRLRLAVRRG